MQKKTYITSAIPYVNAKPHIGHALEFVQTDTIARWHKAFLKEQVVTLSGGDENALKNVQAAEKEGVPIQEFVDTNNALFEKLAAKLNAPYTIWQKGSDQVHHYPSSQQLWMRCAANINEIGESDIYEKSYEGLYCVGCETFYTREELNEQGECFEHPGKKLEKVKEKNYFFRLSRYQKRIIDVIRGKDKEYSLTIIPEKRKHEVLSFLERGLIDISISRSNERAKNWGVPVPGDTTQRIYVWFDALNIYQSGIGFGWDEKKYFEHWPADVQVIGKGIIRFHAVYWPAFLLSAKLKLPKKIFVHEYFTVNGQKMSKTLGNVIDPIQLIDKYGADSLRYYFLAKISPFSDGDFSEKEFIRTYNADLANGLGNLVARVAKLCESSNLSIGQSDHYQFHPIVTQYMATYQFNCALESIWERIKGKDKQMDMQKPWEDTDKKHHILVDLVEGIREIAHDLQPFLPQTSQIILNQFKGPHISMLPPLFQRIVQ